MPSRYTARALWLLCLSGIIAVELFPLISGSGVPAFQHDWAWPVARAQCVPLATAGFEPWHNVGLGIPAVYPESYIYHAVAGSSCLAFGPHAGLVLLLFSALLLCGFGYRRLYYAITAREGLPSYEAIAFTISVVCIANPIVLNKLQAGHVKFLLAYAVLPWIAVAGLNTRSRHAPFSLGILLGVAALDPQFLAYGFVVALVFSLFSSERNWLHVLGAFAVAALINLQQIIPALTPAGTASLNVLAPVLFWQRSQSGHIADALRLTGYIGGYASRTLPGWVLSLYWALPFCALALPFIRFRRQFLLIAGSAAVAICIMAGWNTVLAPLWTFLFSHCAWLAVFRELYNNVAIVMVAYAAGLSIGLTALRAHSRPAVYALCCCLIAISLVAGSQAARGIPLYVPTTAETRAIRTLSDERGFERFAVVPGTAPVTNSQYPGRGGLSPWSLSFDRHGVLFSSTPSDVEMYTHALLRDNSREATAWLVRDDVGFVQYLAGWKTRSIAQADPAARRAERALLRDFTVREERVVRVPAAALVAAEPFSTQPDGLDAPYAGARDVRVLQGGVGIALQNFFSDVSPKTGWARTALTPVLPAWAYTQPLGIFTLRSVAALAAPRAVVVAGDAGGSIHARGCNLLRAFAKHFRAFDCAANPVFAGTPPIVISEVRAGASLALSQPERGSYGSAELASYLPWRITALVHATPGSAVVLRESYTDGWIASLPGARHVMVDGYANAWVISKPVDGIVTFAYAPARTFFFALAISLTTFILSAALMLSYRRTPIA